jgi:predicted O-linked N-acetylglucosamine transferase (SPINDLY family)
MPPNFLSASKPTTKRVGAKFNQALELHDKGRLLKAQALCEEILREQPDHFDSLHLLGVISYKNKRLQLAIDLMERAIKLNPNNADYYYNRGIALHDFKQLDEAVASYDKATQLDPGYAEAYYNRGNALQGLNQLDAALASYDKATQLDPSYAEAYYNRGNALQDLNQLDAALASYDKVIQLKPGYAKVYVNRGNAFQDLRQLDAAVASYDKAIQLDPDYAEAYYSRGNALKDLKQFDAAIASYEKAIQLKPDSDYLFGTLLHTRMQLCDWTNLENHHADLVRRIEGNNKVSSPFVILALTTSLPVQRKASAIWTDDRNPYNPSLGPLAKLQRSNKIRIGYFSADFHNHATSQLMADLFETHDKSRFELIAFSFGPDLQDEMRRRVSDAFDQFIDVRMMSDKSVAELSRNLCIDIAIDLKGPTQDQRIGIFSYRAAPIQVSYIGYPGTIGADYIDYLIADKTIIPDQSQQYYSEKVVYLPNSYQVNDRNKVISDKQFTREELGLPVEGFIFCCFNNNYKITPYVFDSWIRILNAVRGSVLWLFEDNPTAAVNLRKEAQKRGLDPQRVIFAKRMQLPDHLARHRAADLFLDTLPYNAHTTASDALWAGLPILTCMGESFASRVAASLLRAIGLPDLIAADQADYESLAIQLAMNPVKLRSIRDRLTENRLTTALFDTPLFTRHIEEAYREMYERYQNDLLPDHIEIKH